ncbi:hypothetical protein BDZ90DRAFT_232829 [Jaminaea rosea]|uniref:SAP domain-containing protein n=1 Tax=Jaminaea rosea TaxID=1569628 RepID=A0A316UP15_9BASI|nr:hypothetical protein BDZ90DRAFT_232829 [Jaminaea rosea]PWN26704.1 hypothetical protein BDZ90DRAFT_232829 [Jaminaea rosea]
MTSQLTVPELRDTLSSLSLSSQGKKEQLQKRLRKAQRRIRLAEEAAERGASRGTEQDDDVWRPKYRRYLVLDVEATCEEAIYRGGPFVYPNEIIELPVVLLEWRDAPAPSIPNSTSASASSSSSSPSQPSTKSAGQLHLIDVFHSHVRPIARPHLSDFCKTLTGIAQSDIDRAPSFTQATVQLHDWMAEHDLLQLNAEEDDESSSSCASSSSSSSSSPALTPSHRIYTSRLRKDVAWATHGAYDLRDFLPKTAWLNHMMYGPPRWWGSGPLLDVRKAVGKWVQRSVAIKVAKEEGSGSGTSEGEGVAAAVAAVVPPEVAAPATFRDGTIPALLSDLGLAAFEGRLHNGLDDTKNLARILVELSKRVGKEMSAPPPPIRDGGATNAATGSGIGGRETPPRCVSPVPSTPPAKLAQLPPATPPPNAPAGPKRWLAANKQRLLASTPPPTSPRAHGRGHGHGHGHSSSSSVSSTTSITSPSPFPSSSSSISSPSLPPASYYLEPNYTLPDLPPPPTPGDEKEAAASKSGWRYYPKKYAWMGKKVGIVKWHVVEREGMEDGEDEEASMTLASGQQRNGMQMGRNR